MNSVSCSNCELLKDQCKELKKEVALLTEKLDNVLELLFCKHSEKSSQTDPVITESDSVSNIMDHNINVTNSDPEISFDLYNLASSSSDLNTKPYRLINNQPFCQFIYNSLDKEITFTRSHGNRSTCYFGQYPYTYGNTFHEARPLPPSNSYISLILSHLHNVLPNFSFNSVLITKYMNGNDSIGYHSDNEPEIVSDSEVVTISLGGPRVICFRKISETGGNNHEVPLKHGDVFIMSQKSQSVFEHSIPPDSTSQPRISITCRLIQPHSPSPGVEFIVPTDVTTPVSSPVETTQSVVTHETSQINISRSSRDKNTVIYVSSSMFRGLSESKMSSDHMISKVFYYPGANSKQIMTKLMNDPKFLQIDPVNVSKVYLLCGTNNVDQIIGIQRRDYSNIVTNCNAPDALIYETQCDIYNLITCIHNWSQMASINVINILPRVSASRNSVINQLNGYLQHLSDNLPYVYLVGTERHRSLFSYSNGERKNQFFSNQGEDNVHLNHAGVVRLAKYLKYFAHQNTI